MYQAFTGTDMRPLPMRMLCACSTRERGTSFELTSLLCCFYSRSVRMSLLFTTLYVAESALELIEYI